MSRANESLFLDANREGGGMNRWKPLFIYKKIYSKAGNLVMNLQKEKEFVNLSLYFDQEHLFSLWGQR